MEPIKVKVIYERNQNYQKSHATGFWGGMTMDGTKLSIEFIEDLPVIPTSSELSINQDGSFTEENPQFEGQVRKLVHGGVTIPIETIPALIKWMQDKYDEYLTIKQNTNR